MRFFFFKQKTAYEIVDCDWSSDVCSSDLLAKLCLAISFVWGHVLGARVVDRVGKGLRAAPRDALIAENCAPHQRGRAFGLHHSLETVGEIVGPLVGFWVLWQFPENYRGVFAIAFLPALFSVLVLLALVKEPRSPRQVDLELRKTDLSCQRSA